MVGNLLAHDRQVLDGDAEVVPDDVPDLRPTLPASVSGEWTTSSR